MKYAGWVDDRIIEMHEKQFELCERLEENGNSGASDALPAHYCMDRLLTSERAERPWMNLSRRIMSLPSVSRLRQGNDRAAESEVSIRLYNMMITSLLHARSSYLLQVKLTKSERDKLVDKAVNDMRSLASNLDSLNIKLTGRDIKIDQFGFHLSNAQRALNDAKGLIENEISVHNVYENQVDPRMIALESIQCACDEVSKLYWADFVKDIVESTILSQLDFVKRLGAMPRPTIKNIDRNVYAYVLAECFRMNFGLALKDNIVILISIMFRDDAFDKKALDKAIKTVGESLHLEPQ